MKNFLVFIGESYSPCGGCRDFRKDFDTLEEAKQYIVSLKLNFNCEWVQIVDLKEKIEYDQNGVIQGRL